MDTGAVTRLVLIGAGGFARELLAWLKTSNLRDAPVAGVLTDGRPSDLPAELGVPFLGAADVYAIDEQDLFLCAIGLPPAKRRMTAALEARGARFATLIHDTVVIGDRCQIGEGSVLCPRVVLTSDVVIGRHVLLNVATSVGHDGVIGDYSTLSGHVDVTGFARLGEGVFAGTHACVAPSKKVGDWAVVGAGAVVVRDAPAHATVFGNPAKVIRRREPSP
jgi:sugar O-acyltransferase (sialic acid O-acetyltransferase NeuD family)